MTSQNNGDDDDHRARVNLAAAAFIVVIGAAILWVALALSSNQRTQACLQSGRKTCIPLPDGR
ncbi:MAG: hypothetical protein KGQ37_05135 [Hyphomicrobiales bacterium]|nr:hypothetical protein [Hyphomicrobiales bacterium]